jgi:hypothetical protein
MESQHLQAFSALLGTAQYRRCNPYIFVFDAKQLFGKLRRVPAGAFVCVWGESGKNECIEGRGSLHAMQAKFYKEAAPAAVALGALREPPRYRTAGLVAQPEPRHLD